MTSGRNDARGEPVAGGLGTSWDDPTPGTRQESSRLQFAMPECLARRWSTTRCDIDRDEVHIHAFALDAARPAIGAWRATLDAEERARALRFHREENRNAFIVSHGVLRAILGAYLGAAPDGVAIRPGSHGKPVLSAAAGHASPLEFNLSHAAGHALVAVRRGGPVGIDLEASRPGVDAREIGRRAFHPREIDDILRHPPKARPGAGTCYWVAKEALVKGMGVGLGAPIDRIELRFSATGDRASAISHDSGTPCEGWTVRMLPLPDGWQGAVAAVGTSIRLVYPRTDDPPFRAADA